MNMQCGFVLQAGKGLPDGLCDSMLLFKKQMHCVS